MGRFGCYVVGLLGIGGAVYGYMNYAKGKACDAKRPATKPQNGNLLKEVSSDAKSRINSTASQAQQAVDSATKKAGSALDAANKALDKATKSK